MRTQFAFLLGVGNALLPRLLLDAFGPAAEFLDDAGRHSRQLEIPPLTLHVKTETGKPRRQPLLERRLPVGSIAAKILELHRFPPLLFAVPGAN